MKKTEIVWELSQCDLETQMSKCWKNGAYRLEATKLYFVRNTVSAKHRKMWYARSSFPPDKAGNIPGRGWHWNWGFIYEWVFNSVRREKYIPEWVQAMGCQRAADVPLEEITRPSYGISEIAYGPTLRYFGMMRESHMAGLLSERNSELCKEDGQRDFNHLWRQRSTGVIKLGKEMKQILEARFVMWRKAESEGRSGRRPGKSDFINGKVCSIDGRESVFALPSVRGNVAPVYPQGWLPHGRVFAWVLSFQMAPFKLQPHFLSYNEYSKSHSFVLLIYCLQDLSLSNQYCICTYTFTLIF